MKKITLAFDRAWILSKRGESVLPVQALLNFFGEAYDVAVLRSSITDFELVVKNDGISEKEISKKISEVIKDVFSADLKEVAEYTVTDYVPEVKEDAEEDAKADSEKEKADFVLNDSEKVSIVLNKINGLIGAEEFKALCEECVKVAPRLKQNKVLDAFTHRCYLFSMNAGSGYSTYLKYFSELISALGLVPTDKLPVVEEKLLPATVKDRGGNPFESVITLIKQKTPILISIDVSEWMTKISERDFRDFLEELENGIGNHIFVFKIPFVEKTVLSNIMSGLGDFVFIRDVSVAPFDSSELRALAESGLNDRGYIVDEDVWSVFDARLVEEKNDGRFYGFNTVNKIICEMIYRKHLDNAFNDVDDMQIKKNEILGLSTTYDKDVKDGFDVLRELVGVEAVAERVREIVGQIEVALKNKSVDSPCIHMRFVGNPGTGKTTIARVIGAILKEKGILRNGSFFEYSGRDLCGRYVGETSPKTAAICRDAYGSVLFIDEAYALYSDKGYSSVDYGKEAIDTLIAEMENHRSDFVVIMAGYPDEMKHLMKANAGLESRMPYVIEFPNYTKVQLFEIFMKMVNKSFDYAEGFEEVAKEYFNKLPEELISSKEFSNARFVRNLFERTWGKAAMRSQLDRVEKLTLSKEDFLLASSEDEFKINEKKPKNTLGFA
ncbi:MAG: AAA family ATPase [Clostridia bacterium]|nr:AAA family ATPase [Clostridia bacterium]